MQVGKKIHCKPISHWKDEKSHTGSWKSYLGIHYFRRVSLLSAEEFVFYFIFQSDVSQRLRDHDWTPGEVKSKKMFSLESICLFVFFLVRLTVHAASLDEPQRKGKGNDPHGGRDPPVGNPTNWLITVIDCLLSFRCDGGEWKTQTAKHSMDEQDEN